MKKVLLLLFLLLSIGIYAQNGSLSGLIKDNTETLVGATVMIENTSKGASTDINGRYFLQDIEPGTYNFVFSFLGYLSQQHTITINAGQNIVFDVTLVSDAELLEEFVVVGYGTFHKRDVAGSISSIKAKDLEELPIQTFEQVLQGRAAGVQVTSANGVAGGTIKVQVRGTSSISAGSEPLYVIDGIPATSGDYSPGALGSRTNALADLNPNDIESIEVLKDAAAAAIYGSRGANGVVLITTKKGKAGNTKFNAGYYTGVVSETNRMNYISASEHLSLRDSYREQAGLPAETSSTVLGTYEGNPFTRGMADSIAALGGTDWVDRTLRRGSVHEANISASGGNDKTLFYMGGTYRKEKGFLVGNEFERLNGRVNIENKATERLKLGVNIGLAYTNNDRVPIGEAGGLGAAQRLLPYLPAENPDGTYFGPQGLNQGIENPLWTLENRKFNAKVYRTLSNLFAEYKIAENLIFRSEWGIDLFNQVEYEFNFRNTKDPASYSSAWDRRTNVTNWTTNNYFNYYKNFNDIHDITYLLGMSLQSSDTKGMGLNGYNFTNDFFTNPGSASPSNQAGYGYETGYRFDSYFTRMNYKFLNKYQAAFSLRVDGSSRFGRNNRYGFFPAASLGWIVSDEKFFAGFEKLSFLKLRASYGMTGNAEIGDFAALGYFVTNSGYAGNLGIVPSTLPNPDLGWEKSAQFDFNIDYALFNERIAGTLTYYDKKTTDLLLYVNIPTSSGYGAILQNVGSLRNYGLEVSLFTRNIDKNFKWTTDFNISFNRNKVLDVMGLPPDAFESGQPGEGRVMTGYPVGQHYLVQYAGVQQEDVTLQLYDLEGNPMYHSNGTPYEVLVKAGEEVFYDINGNLMPASHPNFYDHRVARGNPVPKFMGGITNTLSFKGFDFSFLFVFVYGNTVYDDDAKNQIGSFASTAQREDILDAWTTENTDTDIPKLDINYSPKNSDRFLYDASFLRLRNITLGYNIPRGVCEKLKFNNMRIYVSGQNLYTYTKFPGWDPEVLRNVQPGSQASNVSFAAPYLPTPQAMFITGGINLSF
ncbi:MAG: TonB-dependent receptor [Bacteroidales bacterium]|nr:TonB-dependent receptor [Bacteroidales bacterium]